MKHGMHKTQPMAGNASKPAFKKTAKKPETDDKPGPMTGGAQPGNLRGKRMKRLKGMMI